MEIPISKIGYFNSDSLASAIDKKTFYKPMYRYGQ